MLGRSSNLIPSALLGVASGILSQSGVATVLTATPPERLPRLLRSPWVKRGAIAAAGLEIVANATVSSLPARSREGLPGRIIMGAASAGLNASVRRQSPGIAAVVGSVSSGGSAIAVTKARAVLSRRIPDPLVALAETLVALALAALAVRRKAD